MNQTIINDPCSIERAQKFSQCIKADDLPGDLPEVAEILDLNQAIMLGLSVGFGKFYLCRWREDESTWSDFIQMLVDVIGVDSTKKICAEFGGTHIDIPGCKVLLQQCRNKAIVASEAPAHIEAVRYGLHINTIHNVRRRSSQGKDHKKTYKNNTTRGLI